MTREDGPHDWIFLNSFDMFSDTVFWKAKFITRFDSKIGLSFASTTAGQTAMLGPEIGEKDRSVSGAGLLIEEEVKRRHAHAPMEDDQRICRGHSSWGTCHRGKACSSAHCMIPTNQLHWCIKAHLSKRDGRRSHTRIAPDAATGYIAPLRETNATGGGAGVPTQPKWRHNAKFEAVK